MGTTFQSKAANQKSKLPEPLLRAGKWILNSLTKERHFGCPLHEQHRTDARETITMDNVNNDYSG